MPPKADISSNRGAHFTHRVLAVFPKQPNESIAEKYIPQPSLGLAHQFFTFDVNYDPSASVLFRFSLVVSQGAPFYLQILPDRIASFERTSHDNTHLDAELDVIGRELGGVRRLLRLHFRLYKTGHLIVPKGFDIDCSDAETLHNFNSIKSLASSLDFSVYMRLHDLTKAKFAIFQEAISQTRTTPQVAALEWKADPSRLYNGKGGAVLVLGEESTSSQASCASTVAVDTPPGYDAEALILPTYQQAYQNTASRVRESGKRRRSSSGSIDSGLSNRIMPVPFAGSIHIQGSCGKSEPLSTGSRMALLEPHSHSGHHNSRMENLEHIIMTLLAKNEQLETRLSQQQLDMQDLMARNEQLNARVSQQQAEMQSLVGAVNELRNQDTQLVCLDKMAERQDELERRQEEHEDSQEMLERRQETIEGDIEAIDVRVTELDGLLDDDWKDQLLDEVRGESVAGVRDYLRNI